MATGETRKWESAGHVGKAQAIRPIQKVQVIPSTPVPTYLKYSVQAWKLERGHLTTGSLGR